MKSPPEREKKAKGAVNNAENKEKNLPVSTEKGTTQGDGESLGIAGDLIGREIGHYRLVKLIGEGATAVVYLAEDYKLERKCAIKILHPMIAKRPGIKDRFLREAKMAAKLKHENIIVIHDFDIDEKLGPFIVMELLEGYSLHQLLEREGALSLERTLKIGEQICSAMEAAHSQGIIHRDLKPENVFLVPRQEKELVKIVDFGLARLTEGASAITGEGKLIGTPLYMSPEQCRGEKNLTPATDIYSFGIMLYEMLTGETPFKGEHPHKLLIDHLLTTPPDLPPSFPESLRFLVKELLSKKPQERPESFRIVQLRLRDAVVITEPEVNKEPTQPRAYNPYIPPPSPSIVKNTTVVRRNKANSPSSLSQERDIYKLPTKVTPPYRQPPSNPTEKIEYSTDDDAFLLTNPDIPTGEYRKVPPPKKQPSIQKDTEQINSFYHPSSSTNPINSQDLFSPVEKTPPRSMSGVRSVIVKRSASKDKRSKDNLINDLEQLFSNNPAISPESSIDSDSATVWDISTEGLEREENPPKIDMASVSYESYNQILFPKPEVCNSPKISNPSIIELEKTSPNFQPSLNKNSPDGTATEFDMRAPTELLQQLEREEISTTPEQMILRSSPPPRQKPGTVDPFMTEGTETELSQFDEFRPKNNRWWLWLIILLLMGLGGLFFYSQLLPFLNSLDK